MNWQIRLELYSKTLDLRKNNRKNEEFTSYTGVAWYTCRFIKLLWLKDKKDQNIVTHSDWNTLPDIPWTFQMNQKR